MPLFRSGISLARYNRFDECLVNQIELPHSALVGLLLAC
jgi:hypothetical protein